MLVEQAVAEALNSIVINNNVTADNRMEFDLWLGLSGGVDSTVLLHAAAYYCSLQCSEGYNRKLKAIHVHHGLSENADEWAKQAQALCINLSRKFSITIDCFVEKVQLDDRSDGLEQAARSARYQAFEKYCGPNDLLLQGHHLDDQIETFFMRAVRGSGLTGLASIPKQRSLSRTNTCQILRPLLAIEKTKIIEYAQQQQLDWVEDESNQDSDIDRNWWRNELLPQIWQRYPKQKHSLSRTINTIHHEQNLLQKLIINDISSHDALPLLKLEIHAALKDIPSFDLLLIKELNQVTSVSYLRAWFSQYVDILPSVIQMQTIYADMVLARADSEPQFKGAEFVLYRYQNRLYLLKTSILNNIAAGLRLTTSVNWQGEELKCFSGFLTCTDLDSNFALKPARYIVRNWQAGDVAKPFGRSTRKMKKWWQDYNVPSWMREHWPMIVNEETYEIAAVPGLFVCQGYCVEQGSSGWLVEYKVNLI